MTPEMTPKTAEKIKRFCDWDAISKEVKRYINEGCDYFTVDLDGFSVKFDGTEGEKDK